MKKITLLLLASTFMLTLSAQTQQIRGIGEIKLNLTVSAFLSKFAPNNSCVKLYTSTEFEKYDKDQVCELVKNPAKNDSNFAQYNENFTVPNLRHFYLPHYQISTNISVDQVNLIFYKEQLVKIEVYSLNKTFMDAFVIKYGQGSNNSLAFKNATTNYDFGEAKINKAWDAENGITCILLKDKSTKEVKDNFDNYNLKIFSTSKMDAIYAIEYENTKPQPKQPTKKELEDESSKL